MEHPVVHLVHGPLGPGALGADDVAERHRRVRDLCIKQSLTSRIIVHNLIRAEAHFKGIISGNVDFWQIRRIINHGINHDIFLSIAHVFATKDWRGNIDIPDRGAGKPSGVPSLVRCEDTWVDHRCFEGLDEVTSLEFVVEGDEGAVHQVGDTNIQCPLAVLLAHVDATELLIDHFHQWISLVDTILEQDALEDAESMLPVHWMGREILPEEVERLGGVKYSCG